MQNFYNKWSKITNFQFVQNIIEQADLDLTFI